MARTKARKIERVGDLSSARLQTFSLCSQLMDSMDCPNLIDPKTSDMYIRAFLFFLLSRQNLTSPIRNVLNEYFVYVIVHHGYNYSSVHIVHNQGWCCDQTVTVVWDVS